MEFNEELYSMKLGERLQHNYLDYFRVPGGWVVSLAAYQSPAVTFVPFDNEFQSNKENK